jgi:alpha-ketoglutarate-dependent taurine dioxygenase
MMKTTNTGNNMSASNNLNASNSFKKFLPKDPAQLRLSVGNIASLNETEVDKIVSIINKHGAVVLKPDIPIKTGADYAQLDGLLGERAPHEKKNKDGIVVIDPFQPNSIGVADTEKAHMAHTDESFLDQPSRFMTLQCRVAAEDGGGESFLVSGAELVDSVLTPEEVEILKQPGMVTVGRTLPGLSEGRVSTQPLIWDENGMLHIRWRSHDSYIKYVAPEAKSAFAKMSNMGMDAAHQLKLLLAPNELMIVDNRANAHGRLPFGDGLARVMWRVNYNGNGSLVDRLSCGFQSVAEQSASSKSVSDATESPVPLPKKCLCKSASSAVAA